VTASPETLLAVGAAVVGASLGSFLNVVVARVPAGLSVVSPRSRCPRCLTPIAWYDNLPVLSWLLLRARCRSCAAPISARYPLVELAGAAAALLALERHGPTPAAPAELAFALVLLGLALIDLDTWLLPHALTLPLVVGAVALGALGATPAGGWREALMGGGVGFAAFAAVHYLGRRVAGREALGFGDVWLLAGLGAFLGVKALLPLVLLASVQGTAVGLVLLGLGRLPPGAPAEPGTPSAAPAEPGMSGPALAEPGAEAEREEEWVPPRNAVPFGPFLVAGALEWTYLSGALARLLPALETFR
jgi:leader peptidase (prepilin peptidase)/N-methyltransferase